MFHELACYFVYFNNIVTYQQKVIGILFLNLEEDDISALERAGKNLFLNFSHSDLPICMVDVF